MSDDRTPEEIEADAAPDNASNPIAVSRKKRLGKDRARREKEALADILSTTNGRLLLRSMLFQVCGINAEIVNAAFDPYAVHYRAGARRVGLELQGLCIAANAENFALLMTEEINGENS